MLLLLIIKYFWGSVKLYSTILYHIRQFVNVFGGEAFLGVLVKVGFGLRECFFVLGGVLVGERRYMNPGFFCICSLGFYSWFSCEKSYFLRVSL